ncbi:plasmid pRiA4b ORF-3 family protein [Caenispirillum bisanense]|uniref:PRiA4b ORF-3-like protein n=1 Tax=Caenispirillum bisanense TaxID=414052 RepID=A0A286H235_9PROT|nr:plasmid pRiA4b ORF-3 family protein [Caenispirillum bisanense]SOE01516.1 pRiA4b ORF-3-like protein [Caenispirillum bisanense]
MTDIIQLKITLMDVDPPVWRRVQVPADYPLRRVHDVIQATMGWFDMHLHEFRIGGKIYGEPDIEGDLAFGTQGTRIHSDRNVKLGTIVARGVPTFDYVYDFGDDWRHEVAVEKVMPSEDGVDYPVLLDWSGACPPEDCGGSTGYADFLAAINDPDHEEHDEVADWWGEDSFDTGFLDLEAVRAMLGRIRAARRTVPRRKATEP